MNLFANNNFLLLYSILILSLTASCSDKTQNVNIVLISTEKQKDYVKICENDIGFYLKKLNKKSDKFKFKLKCLYNDGKAGKSRVIYQNLVSDYNDDNSSWSIIIDNTYGVHLKEVQSIIRENNLPVISMNPDHNDLDFGTSTLFVEYDDDKPKNYASIIKEILNEDGVLFISEFDDPSHIKYIKELEKKGIAILDSLWIESDLSKAAEKEGRDFLSDNLYKMLTKKVSEIKKDTPILINVHSPNGKLIIEKLSKEFSGLRIMIPIYSTSSLKTIGNTSNDNIYYTFFTPEAELPQHCAISYVNNLKGELTLELEGHSSRINWLKRCFNVTNVIQQAVLKGEEVGLRKYNKDMFETSFKLLKGASFFIDGEKYEFDRHLLKRNLIVGKVENNKTYINEVQLDNSGQISTPLLLGVDIESINEVNFENSFFTTDFTYWLKIPDAEMNIFNAQESMAKFMKIVYFKNIQLHNSTIQPYESYHQSGYTYLSYKASARFSLAFDLKSYPFDKHLLQITPEIRPVWGYEKIAIDRAFDEIKDDKSLRISNFKLNSRPFIGVSYVGRKKERKVFTFNYPISHKAVPLLISIILPLFLLGIVTFYFCILQDYKPETLHNIGSSLMLVGVASAIPILEVTPNTGILKSSDMVYVATLLMIFIAILFAELRRSSRIRSLIKQMNNNKLHFVIFSLTYTAIVMLILF